MIGERKLYKRLLVISPRKNDTLWDGLRKFRKEYTWTAWIALQLRYQELVVKILDGLNDDQRTVTSLGKNIIDDIVSRSFKKELLLLIDIPAERKGSSYCLDFLKEKRFDDPFKVVSKEEQTEDSVIWKSLADDFLKSVGKVRIFCHPDVIDTFSTIKRAALESSLASAVNYISKELPA